MGGAWLCLMLAVLCSTGGNSLAKLAGSAAGRPATLAAGAALFGTGLLFYTQALSALPLALAYPMLVGASMVGVSLVAVWRFGERISAAHAAGMALVLAGLAVLATGLP